MTQRFKLSEAFIGKYTDRKPPFGFVDAAGSSLGEITFLRTYSRLKEDGTKETWTDTCRRVIEGMYEIQRQHIDRHNLPWSTRKAQGSAQEAFDSMWHMKWLPPGRGLWSMGTEAVLQGNGAPLLNCAYVSTERMAKLDPGHTFGWIMEASMLGIGVGFDGKGAGDFTVIAPTDRAVYTVPDTREGWAESLRRLINGYLVQGIATWFDYSLVRPAGAPIKTFGGTASGPDPLKQLHESVRHVLDNRIGEKITLTDIADIGNLIGVCVVAGNVRRSAELFMGAATPEFLGLKDYSQESGLRRAAWSWMSNNTVEAKTTDDLSGIVPGIIANGEPGVIWMDTSRKYGRLTDPADGKDWRAAGTNPCLPGFSRLMTPDGLTTMEQIQVGDTVWSVDGWVTVKNKWDNGIKEVFSAKTSSGELFATAKHRVVQRGVKVELQDAKSIDTIELPVQDIFPSANHRIMDGLFFGDGYRHGASQGTPFLCIGAKDQDYFRSEVAHLIGAPMDQSDMQYRVAVSEDALVDGTVTNRPVPDAIINGTLTDKASWLRGLFTANGSVITNTRVALKSTNEALIHAVQVMLWELGIQSYLTHNKAHQVVWGNGTYTSKASIDLNINHEVSVARFTTVVGFLQKYKMEALEAVCGTKSSYPRKILSYDSVGEHRVYDIHVSGESHTYWTDGLSVSNCGEQTLESWECCTLTETFPTRCESLEDYQRAVKYAYLYAKSVTLMSTPWPETNAVMLRNRRIGTSMTGVADFVDQHGCAELIKWQHETYGWIQHLDTVYSEWLGIRESIKTTSIKPSGTVSILAGVSPGVHWQPGTKHYFRLIRMRKDDPLVTVARAANYRVEPAATDPTGTVVVYFPMVRASARGEHDVSLQEKLSLAQISQRYWADNSVSVTLTYHADEIDQINGTLEKAATTLKSVSFLPLATGSYEQMPYTQASEEEIVDSTMTHFPIDTAPLYRNGTEAIGEKFCSNDTCAI